MIAVAVASEQIIARIDENKARLAKLADPRTIEHGRWAGGADRAGHDSRVLHHRDDSLAGGGRANRADGDGLPAGRGRQRVHPEHPRQRPHAHHSDRRSGRPRSHGRSVQLVEEVSAAPGPAAPVLGQIRRPRQQSRRDGRDAQADGERAEHGGGVERHGAARSARVGAVSLRQHRAGRRLQRVDRSAVDQRMAHVRLEQRPGNDAHGHAWRLCRRHVGQLVAGLSVLPRRDAQRDLPSVRDVRQRRQRRHARADADAGPDVADVVPTESAASARDVVAAQQQQLHPDRPARLVELHREQSPAVHRELLREEQALDSEGADRGSGGVGAERRRAQPRAAGGSARRSCRSSTSRSRAPPRRFTSTCRKDAAARVPGRQLRHPHGPAVFAGRRRHPRLPVLESGRDRHARTTTRAGRSPRASACRRSAWSTPRFSTCPWRR